MFGENNQFPSSISKENPLESKRENLTLPEQIILLKMRYIQKILDKSIVVPKCFEGKDFKDLFYTLINIWSDVGKQYLKVFGHEPSPENNNFKECVDSIVEELEDKMITEPGSWINSVFAVITGKIKNLSSNDNYPIEKAERIDETAGILQYDRYPIIEIEDPEKYGLKKYGNYLDITLNPAYEDPKISKEDISLSALYKESFEELARKIIHEEQTTEAVTRKTWLLSTNLGKDSGFHIVDDEQDISGDMNTFGQFIKKDGTLNHERVEEFLKTGILPFKTRQGFMKTQEFLERYAPDEERGKTIYLKRPIEKYGNVVELNMVFVPEFFRKWNELSLDEVKDTLIHHLLTRSYVKTGKGKKWLDHILKTKEMNGTAREAFSSNNPDGWKECMEDDLYEEYDLVIPKRVV